MPIHAANVRLKERIYMMGGPGSGKTYDYYKIAEWHQKTGSDAKFYVLDTDNASDRMLATEFAHLENVVDPYLCFEWGDIITAKDEIASLVRPHDWTMMDMFGPTWDTVQAAFIESIFGNDYTSFFLQARLAEEASNAKPKNPLDGWKDWSVINKMYRDLTVGQGGKLGVMRWPSHLYCTGPTAAVSADNDSKEIKAQFGRLGVKPKGQKEIAHHFHTILWKMVNQNGWEITTAKDRGREMLQGEGVSDFVMSYLVKVAGWKLA